MKLENFKKASSLLDSVTTKTVMRKRFVYKNMFGNWELIVGSDFSNLMQPLKLEFQKRGVSARLIVKMNIANSAEIELLSERMRERINEYFGFTVVRDVKFRSTNDFGFGDNRK